MYNYNSSYGATTRRTPGFFKVPSSRYSYSPGLRRQLSRYRRRGGYGQRNSIRSIIRSTAEHKYWDIYNPGFLVSETGSISDLSAIAVGNTVTTRVGDKIHVQSHELIFNYFLNVNIATDGIYAPTIRLIVFSWKDDTVPIVGDILEAIGSGPTIRCISPFNHDKKVKRKILLDHFMDFSLVYKQYYSCGNDFNQTKKFFINLKNKKGIDIYYSSGSTTGVNKIYALFIADTLAGATTNPAACTLSSRINYTDI